MKTWVTIIGLCITSASSSVHGEDVGALLMKVSAEQQYLAQLPVICDVIVENVSSQDTEVYLPSQRASTLSAAVRRVGSSDFLERNRFITYIGYGFEAVTLKPHQDVGASMNVSEAFSGGLPVGEYECRITYRFGDNADDELEQWTQTFSIVEPSLQKDKEAKALLGEVQLLLKNDKTEAALMLLSNMGDSADGAPSEYLAKAHLETAQYFSRAGRWRDAAVELEKLKQHPPKWLSTVDLDYRLGVAYCEAGEYQKGMMLLSGIAKENPLARGYLDKAKRGEDGYFE